MHIHRTPWLLKAFFPNFLWRVPHTQKVFLTFDDGPIPMLTPWVLDTLASFGVKATFFCVGDNILKNSFVYERLIAEGHQAANHTQNHLKGWKTPNQKYLENIALCESQLNQKQKLFRPPYGRIRASQAKLLLPDYQIVMWDVLTCDYSASLSPKDCLKASLRYTRPGSIVVFHDNLKAKTNLTYTLPRYLEVLLSRGQEFGLLGV
jgi:peptidoglycan/xylan/chitin deacetylase (PgdA/CDA1 family)